MAAHEEMQRVAAAEHAMAKQAAQHADELAALQAQLEEQRQLLHSTQEERDFHRDAKLEMRGELSETLTPNLTVTVTVTVTVSLTLIPPLSLTLTPELDQAS